MNSNDDRRRSRLAQLQEKYGATFFQDVPDTTGEDDLGRLRVAVNAAREVVDVTVLDLDRLVSPADLSAAFTEAFHAAEIDRMHASIERAGGPPPGEASTRQPRRIRVPALPDVSREASAERRARRPLRAPVRSEVTGVSADGGVAIDWDRWGEVLRVRADDEWLRRASAGRLRSALLEASRAGDGEDHGDGHDDGHGDGHGERAAGR